MKRCPACLKVMTDDAMLLCPYDGTPLFDTETNSKAFHETLKTDSGNLAQTHDPSLEKAAQIDRQLQYGQELYRLLNSAEGIRLADAEMQIMFGSVKDKVELINQKYPSLEIKFGTNSSREATVSNPRYVVIMSWQLRYVNTLSDSSLEIVERTRNWYPRDSDELNRLSFDFYMDEESKFCWKERGGKRCLLSQELGEECLNRLLRLISSTDDEHEDGSFGFRTF